MIRRPTRREVQAALTAAIARADEVKKLRRKVADLEAALARVDDHDAELIVDVRGAGASEMGLAGFAAEWSKAEAAPDGLEAFFSAGQPDVRARRWLLASS